MTKKSETGRFNLVVSEQTRARIERLAAKMQCDGSTAVARSLRVAEVIFDHVDDRGVVVLRTPGDPTDREVIL